MLGIAGRAPCLRSLDLSFSGGGSGLSSASPVSGGGLGGAGVGGGTQGRGTQGREGRELRLGEMTYPRLERQRISGNGIARFVSAPCLRSLTLVDAASMSAVDALMSSRPSSLSSGAGKGGRRAALFPQLRTLTFQTPSPASYDSSPRFNNLARFVREHERLETLCVMACWDPVPMVLDVALCQSDDPLPQPSGGEGSQQAEAEKPTEGEGEEGKPTVPCPRLTTLSLHLTLSPDLPSLARVARVIESLLTSPSPSPSREGFLTAPTRAGLKVELICRADFELGEKLGALMGRSEMEFGGRLVRGGRR